MPTRENLGVRLEPYVLNNLTWIYRWNGVRLPRQQVAAEARRLAAEILARLERGCSCAERWLPPVRSREDFFWRSVERCEREHQITLQDLAQAGILMPPENLQRAHDSVPVEATVTGAGCLARARFQEADYPLLAEALRAAVHQRFPGSRSYTSDTRFWQAAIRPEGWTELDENDLPALSPPVQLRGWYLGFPVHARLTTTNQIEVDGPEGSPFDSLSAAAEAARAYVAERLQPHRPWAGCRCVRPGESPALEDLRKQFWDMLLESGFTGGEWLHNSCHQRSSRQESLDGFLEHAATGSRLPRLGDFPDSLMFAVFTFPDRTHLGGKRLELGQVLYCPYGHESNGRCAFCAGFGVQSPAGPRPRVFPEGSRQPVEARRCVKCENHWYIGGPFCPLDGGEPGLRTVTVWV